MKVMLGVSGGVDSSVAALLLQQQGYAVSGLFMQNWDEEDDGECRAEQDRKDALGGVRQDSAFPSIRRNFAKAYWSEVFELLSVRIPEAGRTPNPDVLCNREIKFKTFLDEALALGAEKIATGHYAQVRGRDGVFELLRGADAGKDQSYFLHQLGQSQLAATLFPIGHLPKSEVRTLAAGAGFGTGGKKRFHRDLLHRRTRLPRLPVPSIFRRKAGEIRSVDGQKVGEHAGVFYYTLGQREGLHIGGIKGRPAAPWFVVGKDIANGTSCIVDQGIESALAAFAARLQSETAHWIAGQPACTRKHFPLHRQDPLPSGRCRVSRCRFCLIMARFIRGCSTNRSVRSRPGQSLVLYHG